MKDNIGLKDFAITTLLFVAALDILISIPCMFGNNQPTCGWGLFLIVIACPNASAILIFLAAILKNRD
jgi:hypothetical protein